MYEQFFHLRRRPFPAVPSLRHYVALRTTEEFRVKLTRCLARGEGVGLIVGPTGTGKTLLCRAVGADLAARCEVVMPAVGRIPSRKALFQAVLFELHRPYQGMDDGELRLALMDYLLSPDREKPLVLIVDEADTLSLRMLDELRLLLNLGRGEEPPLRLLLSGGTLLEEKLAAGKLQPLSQRISARCYLDALSRADTFTYVREQIRLCGGNADAMLSEETLAAVYHATGGVPRLINQICDHVLLLAFADEIERITPELVQEAWSDLQQLPMPWEPAPERKSSSSQVVEFGTWDEGLDAVSTSDGLTEDIAGDSQAGSDAVSESPNDERLGDDASAPEVAATGDDELSRNGEATRFHGPGRTLSGPTGAFPVPSGESLGGPAADVSDPIELRPLEHLRQAEQAVRQLQQEFRPPATKTEVELIFEDWGNPFEEEFQQVIPVTGGPVPDTATRSQRECLHSPTLEEATAEKPSAETDTGTLEIVIEGDGGETAPTAGDTPPCPEDVQEPEPQDAGVTEVLIFDNHVGEATARDEAEHRRCEVGPAVRSPKFRRLFSQLKQRAAASPES
ncbi:ExeA family protein [Thermopirellula anaerolimosa]